MNKSKGMIFLLAGLASLTLVIAVAYFFFSREQAPKPTAATTTPTAQTPATTPVPDTFDPVEWSRKPQTPDATGLTPPATAPDGNFVVTMPQDPSATSSTTTPAAKPNVAFPVETPKSSPTAVELPTGKITAPAKIAPKAPSKPTAVAKAPAKVVTSAEFWIQVGAFKDRYQADAVSKTLENQGLKGTLTTATVNGAAVVRVRVGPYTNQDEAKKFLAWVKPVKGLEAAYITETKATRTQ